MRVTNDNCRSLPASVRELGVAVRNDEEINNSLSCVTIAQGGILSDIYKVLLPRKKEKNRGGSRNPATAKKELFVAIRNG